MPTEKEPYYHGNMVVENCEFASPVPISANYMRNIRFVKNKSSIDTEMSLELKNCGESETEGCIVIRKTEKKEQLNFN